MLVTQLQRAESMASRMVGLLGKPELPAGAGLLIVPCNQVHTFGMKFVIDVVFLDSSQRILKICHNLKPWRLSPLVWRAKAVLELRAGEAATLQVGNLLHIVGDRVEVCE